MPFASKLVVSDEEDKITYEIIKDYALNFIALRSYLEEKTVDKNTFDFLKEFKTEAFKLIQSRELHRMISTNGQLILTKSGTGKYVYPLITSVLDSVKTTDFNDFVSYLNLMFKPFDQQNTNSGRLF